MGRDPIGACRTQDPSQSCPPTRASQRAAARGGTGNQQREQRVQGAEGDCRRRAHKYVHVAVVIDTRGTRLGDHSLVANSWGYRALIRWADTHGRVEAFGVEGTGSYGAGLTWAVRRAGHRVVEVHRADRRTRRTAGKSDTIDAEVAARSVLAGQSTATPKTADGVVEMLRQLKIVRDTAVKARTAAMITLKQLVVHAPPQMREALQALTGCSRAAQHSDLAPSTRPPRPPSTRSVRSLVDDSPSPRKSPRTTDTSRGSRPRRRPPCARASGSALTPPPSC